MNDLTEKIINYYEHRQLKQPTSWEALAWAHTEIGEAYEVLLSEVGGWVRNNPQNKPEWDRESFGEELGDAVMMLIVAGHSRGVDVVDLLCKKMERKLDNG